MTMTPAGQKPFHPPQPAHAPTTAATEDDVRGQLPAPDQLFATLLNSFDGDVAIFDHEWHFLHVNQQAVDRLGGDEAYDVLLYVANWPERRRYAWQTLIKARAIENLSYCVAVNCVGQDGNGINYTGDSAALDNLGQPLTEASEREFVTTVTLDRNALQAFRNKFPAHLDADEFDLHP